MAVAVHSPEVGNPEEDSLEVGSPEEDSPAGAGRTPQAEGHNQPGERTSDPGVVA